MDQAEKRISGYSSLLISLAMNSGKLLALRENGIVARYWHFDLVELGFQFLYNLLFCAALFYLNLEDKIGLTRYRNHKQYGIYYLCNILFILVAMLIGTMLQYILFANNRLPGVFWLGYFARFGLSSIMIGIIIRIILLLRESKQKDKAHEQLKSTYLEAQLELLKEQINPHLLFNSLSSLSGIVREDPKLAQFYIFHLSKVFRHALTRSGTTLVTLADEIKVLKSYGQLLSMRLEKAFHLQIDLDENDQSCLIPHLSLQPLLENAAKHNSATIDRPLIVRIHTEDEWLIVSNNLQEISLPESSTGIGLVNLNERFRLLVNREIGIEKTNDMFVVKLPLRS